MSAFTFTGTLNGRDVSGAVRDGVLTGHPHVRFKIEGMMAAGVTVREGPFSDRAALDDPSTARLTIQAALDTGTARFNTASQATGRPAPGPEVAEAHWEATEGTEARRWPGLLESGFDGDLHPRDRRGRWIKKLKALKVGDGARAEMSGIGVRRTESGFQVLNSDRVMGFPVATDVVTGADPSTAVSVMGGPLVTVDSEEEALAAVADMTMLPEAREGEEGTLLDPRVIEKMVDGFSEGTFRAGVTRVSFPQIAGSRPTVWVEGITADMERGVTGGWKIRLSLRPDGTYEALHDEMVAPTARGGGAAFFRYLESEYAKRNVARVKLYAAMTRGGYVWAREGFRFQVYEGEDAEDRDAQERGRARGLLISRWEDWSYRLLEDLESDGPHIREDLLREFIDRFAGTEPLPEDRDEWETYYPDSDDQDAYDSEVIHGYGGPYFQSPQEIAMFGVDEAWEEQGDDGKPIKMWLGKQFLMGSKWEGIKDIPQARPEVAEADSAGSRVDTLLDIVRAVNADMPDADDHVFWVEVARRWRSTPLQEGWREILHPRGRAGQFIDVPDAPEVPEVSGRWLTTSLDGFADGGLTARVKRKEIRGPYATVTLDIEDEIGDKVGVAKFTTASSDGTPAGVYATIDNVWVRPDRRGGFAGKLLQRFYEQCRANGVPRVNLHAVQVGGYYWASSGYVWRKPPADEQARILQDAKADGRWAEVEASAPSATGELEALVAGGAFTSEAELAAWGREHAWKDEAGVVWWPGKRLMVGAVWDGERAP